MNSKGKLVRKGFTLVELLIVVIILAILAAIVIPQFTTSTTDAQESALDSNLAALRSAIELYKVQHGAYPGDKAASGATCPSSGTASTAAAGTVAAWMDQLLMSTDATGKACSIGDTSTFKFGPYIRKGIPADPINGKGSVAAEIAIQTTGAPLAPDGTAGGWKVDSKSGQIIMNSSANDSKSKAFSTH